MLKLKVSHFLAKGKRGRPKGSTKKGGAKKGGAKKAVKRAGKKK